MNSPTPPTFEQSLEQLNKTAKALETGQLSLEESLKQFEEGMKLVQSCTKYLTEAERKIEILLKQPKANGAPDFGDFYDKS